MEIEEEKVREEQSRVKKKGRPPGSKNHIPAQSGQKRTYTKEQAERKNELRRHRRLDAKVAQCLMACDCDVVLRMNKQGKL